MRAPDRLFDITTSAGERAASFEPLLSRSRAHTLRLSSFEVIGPNILFETRFDTDSPDRFIAFAKPLRSSEEAFPLLLLRSRRRFFCFPRQRVQAELPPKFDRSASSICVPPIDCLTSQCLQESKRDLLSHFCQGLALILCGCHRSR